MEDIAAGGLGLVHHPVGRLQGDREERPAREGAASQAESLPSSDGEKCSSCRPAFGPTRLPEPGNERRDGLKQEPVYTLDDVLGLGFEARCLSEDGSYFLWHGICGLRVSPGGDRTVLITDSATLPQSPWFATRWGREELKAIGIRV